MSMQNDMRDRLISLINQDNCPSPYMCDNKCKYSHLEHCFGDRLADHLIANGVIVPPCKVGDTVYYIRFGEIIETVVSCISFTKSNIHFETWENPYSKSFELYNIGVVVFLTKEQAEQKLKEMRVENGNL